MIEQSLAREPRIQQEPVAEYTTHEQRLIRAYLEGAESGMVEARGYGLTEDERRDAERQAHALYGKDVD
ncbi:hypothetical protein [Rubrobacter aplysinae]|uniref:hypothetical protein n=1 Tax=Rubrobacter aplysinae TaxID=909625 RepID=UPI00064BD15B|nr:hypothetical protein [Rubrobacter aplysinae]